jgi:hypothetical protein
VKDDSRSLDRSRCRARANFHSVREDPSRLSFGCDDVVVATGLVWAEKGQLLGWLEKTNGFLVRRWVDSKVDVVLDDGACAKSGAQPEARIASETASNRSRMRSSLQANDGRKTTVSRGSGSPTIRRLGLVALTDALTCKGDATPAAGKSRTLSR